MSIQPQAAIRSKKLGVLLRDARLLRRKTLPECAEAVGTTAGILRAWEEGRKSPSLPELEILAHFLSIPVDSFWSDSILSEGALRSESLDIQTLIKIRQRFIGASIRQEREKSGLSLQKVSELSGISTKRLKTLETGQRPFPVPELEGLITILGGTIESLFDQKGPIGTWMVEQKAVESFQQLPVEIQEFVSRPVNRPYLDLAMKLSNISSEKLRSVAENILDITY